MNEKLFGVYLYFSSIPIIFSLILPILSMGILCISFKRISNIRIRCWSLGLIFVSSLFLWLFIATSLILCYTFIRTNPSELAIRDVFGSAILIAMAGAVPLSLTLRVMSPKIVLGRVRGIHPANRNLERNFDTLARLMKVATPELRVFSSNVPISFAVETSKPTVVISERLMSLLTKDEMKAVLAHELGHIKNSDTTLKSMITAYRTALPFDPIIRIVEAAFHREREILADESAALATRKPLTLASALLKIHQAFPKNSLSSQGALSILGVDSTLTKRYPSISDRINHMIWFARMKPTHA
ncbi:MAG TPA: M56 family metallopeptidase [Candidatus Saccharimonadales bacterium]|nr:M56 family metallopeptidase [Candidatus Saccharimonadales bacterium]